MTATADLLIELQTAELPARDLPSLTEAWRANLITQLQQAQLTFTTASTYYTPRRMALLVKDLQTTQAAQTLIKKGPAISIAITSDGQPTAAGLGFAKSCGVDFADLAIISNDEGQQWLQYQASIPAQPTITILPELLSKSLKALVLPKSMRWSNNHDYSFLRPVHQVIALLGGDIVKVQLYGVNSSNTTSGHRYYHPESLLIKHPNDYLNLLRDPGKVIADPAVRTTLIIEQANNIAASEISSDCQVLFDPDLLNEVTNLVEWPVAICGSFDPAFLSLPQDLLIAVMQHHQRYFPVVNAKHELLPYFIAINNIASSNPTAVITANNQVLAARLHDAAFFVQHDQESSLASKVPLLNGIVFHQKLGTMMHKIERITALSEHIAQLLNLDRDLVVRAAYLAKADLCTTLVAEFPELQGIIGAHYARHDHEDPNVANAIAAHYLPRNTNDSLPDDPIGSVIAIADRLDTIVGFFGINAIPSGTKDPYALRRNAIAVLKIILHQRLPLNLTALIEQAISLYSNAIEQSTARLSLGFITERFNNLMQEQGITPDILAATQQEQNYQPYQQYQHILALQEFKQSPHAVPLIQAHKRINNIIAKHMNHDAGSKIVKPALLLHAEEQELAAVMTEIAPQVAILAEQDNYPAILAMLYKTVKPVEQFFANILVMDPNPAIKANRIALLQQLSSLLASGGNLTCLDS